MPPKDRQPLVEVEANSKAVRRTKTSTTGFRKSDKSDQDPPKEQASRKRKSDVVDSPKDSKKPKAPKSPGRDDKKNVPDISDIHLEGEESGAVPIYDTCDMVRSKVKLFLKQHPSESNASLARRMGTSSNNLSRFREKKGYDKGNTSTAFYDAYVYLEKVRLAQGKPKSKDRQKMEELWGPSGFDTTTNWNNKGLLMRESEHITRKNKYGEFTITCEDGRQSSGVM